MRGRPIGIKNKVLHKWTENEKEYLEQIIPGHHYKEIQAMINEKYSMNLNYEQIKGAISRAKVKTGFTGCFNTDHVPFNKGKKGLWFEGSEKSWFKSGTIPPNHQEVGTEKITSEGYVTVKIAEPNKWRLKQQIEWERFNGKIKKGYVVIFGDGNRQNSDINNLILVSRQQLLTLNRNKLIQNDVELTKTGVIIANLYQKMSIIKKERG